MGIHNVLYEEKTQPVTTLVGLAASAMKLLKDPLAVTRGNPHPMIFNFKGHVFLV